MGLGGNMEERAKELDRSTHDRCKRYYFVVITVFRTDVRGTPHNKERKTWGANARQKKRPLDETHEEENLELDND
ncbi:unnamed protein product [Nippostrongylus brasiliensis]|uniref:Uncharacterized protein n=1 Tax=Nippostrongylus brasiliensis TaxID=27835 RepID=A0A0N4YME5_NIPBR|nr:unnamed protein product [Nippostrongylus brasiliensis]